MPLNIENLGAAQNVHRPTAAHLQFVLRFENLFNATNKLWESYIPINNEVLFKITCAAVLLGLYRHYNYLFEAGNNALAVQSDAEIERWISPLPFL